MNLFTKLDRLFMSRRFSVIALVLILFGVVICGWVSGNLTKLDPALLVDLVGLFVALAIVAYCLNGVRCYWGSEFGVSDQLTLKLEQAERSLDILRNFNVAVNQDDSEVAVWSRVCHNLIQKGKYRSASVGVFEGEDDNAIRPIAHAGDRINPSDPLEDSCEYFPKLWRNPAEKIPFKHEAVSHAFGGHVLIHRRANLRPGEISSFILSLPLVNEGDNLLGYLTVCSDKNPPFSQPEIELLQESATRTLRDIEAIKSITSLRSLTNELAESEFKFSKIFHSCPVPMFIEKAADGTFLDLNEECLKLFKTSREEVVGRTSSELGLWSNPNLRQEVISKIIKDGGIRNYEINTFNMLHEPCNLLWSAELIVLDDENYFLGSAVDITERKREESKRHLQLAALSAAADAIAITDDKGNVEWINQAFSILTGYKSCEIVGRNIRMLRPSGNTAEFYEKLWRDISGGCVWRGEVINRRKDGSLFNASCTITPVCDPVTQSCHYILIGQDVTERPRLEQKVRQSQKMEAIGQLAGGIAHDFNNVLAALMIQAELLEATKGLPEDVVEGVRQIIADANRAASLTRQLLLFSRCQAVETKTCDLNKVVANLGNFLRRVIGEHMCLTVDLSSESLLTCADSCLLDQVLLNLVVNSRDAMPKGGCINIRTSRIEITTEGKRLYPDASVGTYVCLDVSDTGRGISPEDLPKIFEPFFTTKEIGKGTGLGLATVFGIVKQHKGWITVDSKLGVGTLFRVFFPAAEDGVVIDSCSSMICQTMYGTETILLVEDDSVVRTQIANVLDRLGYVTLCAPNVEVAYQLWRQKRNIITLLISDIVMPGETSGFSLAREFVGQKPELKVIFTSGYNPDFLGLDAQLQSNETFLPKPFGLAQLATEIRKLVDNRSEKQVARNG
jgi:two-component system, cell cycle sensor histidine kinase and response regulator CckA